MARSSESFNKKEKEKIRLKKRQDKEKKKDLRKSNSTGSSLDDMIAYVDENGRITDTPPDPTKRTKIDAETIEISIPKRTEEEIITTRKGRVEFFDETKGFGFIKELDTQEKYYVHVRGLLEPIRERDLVTFELERGMKGMNCVKVKKA